MFAAYSTKFNFGSRLRAGALVGAAAYLLTLSACTKVDISTLPPLPDVQIHEFLSGVQDQLNTATKAVDANPGSETTNGHLAMLYHTYKLYSAASAMYERTRIIAPDEFKWPYLHALAQDERGNRDQAISALNDALKLQPRHLHAQLQLAEWLAQSGETDVAKEMFENIMATSPEASEAYFSYGKFLLLQNKPKKAAISIKESLRRSGDFGAAYYQLGLAYRQLGDRAEAERNLKLSNKFHGLSAASSDDILNELLALNRSDTPFIQRAKILAENGRLAEAQKLIRMALERNPDSVAAHASMIGMATQNRDFAKADSHFQKAVALAPDNAKIYFNLGMARIAEQRMTEAQQAFETSLEKDNTDPNTFVQLSLLKHRAGDIADTRWLLGKALDLEPAHAIANWLRAEIYAEQKQYEKALPFLKRARQVEHPMSAWVYVLSSETAAAMNDMENATLYFQAARDRIDPTERSQLQERLNKLANQIGVNTNVR